MGLEIGVKGIEVEAELDGTGDGVALQIDGNDLVWVKDIDWEEGTAVVTVFASSAELADIVWRGTVSITGHL